MLEYVVRAYTRLVFTLQSGIRNYAVMRCTFCNASRDRRKIFDSNEGEVFFFTEWLCTIINDPSWLMDFDDSVEEMTRPRANCIIFYKRVLNILKYGKKEKEREKGREVVRYFIAVCCCIGCYCYYIW